MPLRLSVIIPFYNVEPYIAECLDSVFDQDIPLDEYEVICVNDGSPDNSRAIVLDYMRHYPNLHLVEHEVNKKLGAARNTGRAVAKGKYIWNVDSDDKIVPNCLGHLLNVCEKNDLDVLEFGTFRFSEIRESQMPHVKLAADAVAGLDYLNQLGSYEVSRMCAVWRKMIRREFLDENRIYSPEINMGEDIPFSFRLLMMAKRLMVIPDRCYLYRENPESLTGKGWVPTASALYEKCITDSRLVYDVAAEVPDSYLSVRNAYLDAARYTLELYRRYVPRMTRENRMGFRRMCRKKCCSNDHVRKLLSRKQYFKYLIWLIGLSRMPK